MSVYERVGAAIVRALAADNIDNSAKQSWHKLVTSAPAGGFSDMLSARDRFDFDCCLHALLHRELSSGCWDVLVAKFSSHDHNRIQAIGRLHPRITSPAPKLFVMKAVATWAVPKMKGLQQTKEGKEVKRSTKVLMFRDEMYDMNTWDLDARPDSTRSRWRRDVHKQLERLLAEAQVQVTEILEREGLLSEVA